MIIRLLFRVHLAYEHRLCALLDVVRPIVMLMEFKGSIYKKRKKKRGKGFNKWQEGVWTWMNF